MIISGFVMDYHRALGTSVNTVSKQHTQSNMNKRIKELAEQAGEYVNNVYTPPVRSKTPGKIWEDGHIDWQTQFNQKFAELITQECIAQVAMIGVSNFDSDIVMWTVEKSIDSIKEHFGIEEGGEEEVFSCPACGLQNPTTTCGLPNCGLIY